MKPAIEVYRGADGQWYWRLKGKNGEGVIPPEGHTLEKDARRAARTAKTLMAKAEVLK